VLTLEWKENPVLLIVCILMAAGIGVVAAANVFFKQVFFDAVGNLVEGNDTVSHAVACGVGMAAFLVATLVLSAVAELVFNNVGRVIMGHMGSLLNDKASRVDPVIYEDNRYLDQINKAYVGMEAVGTVVFTAMSIGLNDVAYFVFMGCYLFSIKPMLLVVFALSFLPTMIGSTIRRKMFAKMENLSAPYRRKYEYFEKCLCSREYAKETRLWRGESYFGRLFQKNLDEYTKLQWQTTRRSELLMIALRFLLLSGYVGTIIMLFYFLFQGEIGIGAFAAIFSTLDRMFDNMDGVFNYEIGAITRNFGAAQNYYAFLDLREREGTETEILPRETMELKKVSFTYPNSKKAALEDIDLTVHKGETIAIVGVNGSGKSTLTRLLTGLYLPTAGEMLIDGRKVEEIAPKSLYRDVSAVFQRYQSYKMTVSENVRISETEKELPEDGKQAADKTWTAAKAGADRVEFDVTAREGKMGIAVRDALEKADFPADSEKLTEGLETMLGKDFGGIDLSGGQWQRLAIARGLYRDHDMIVLDEPTAAIDPLEEADIYRKFAEISADKTAFIVTHRLGSAQIADRIIVMDAGHIVDMGTHEELMQREGKYREMYHAQAKWYV
ncbi:MAG: ABC transporter ATP-binding protein/permease, partial [Acetatifactor sp.]|nr:ABC transporter ATP-binding protein/permease [Acetatifactor sp.]